LTVEGMTCSSCVRHVESALRELEGIEDVEVKLKDGRVRVEYDPSRSTIGEMIQALDEAGYGSRAGP
jgi:copper ion binding protein